MLTNRIQCLMIGQHGIGKTTFLQNFPNIEQTSLPDSRKESFKFNCVNSKQYPKKKTKFVSEGTNEFDNIDVEIDNYDITAETYINTNDLMEGIEIETTRLINANSYQLIILAFSMDDSQSFELVKSKWETELKRNSKYNFILLGLKSDVAENIKTEDKENEEVLENLSIDSVLTDTTSEQKKKFFGLKKSNTFAHRIKRSCSINSNSSTSKFELRKQLSSSDNELNAQMFTIKVYRNFAKQIGGAHFIESTNVEKKTVAYKINKYTLFTQNICSIFNNLQLQSSNSSLKQLSNSENTFPDSNFSKTKIDIIREKVPRSLTAPIDYLVKKKNSPNKILTDNFVPSVQETSATFTKLDNDTQLNIKSDTTANVSVKEKLSRLFLGLGTYIVTCGSANSRKLVIANRLKNMKVSKTHNDLNHNKLVDKSWLLLSSHNSLNSFDDAYTN